MCPLTATIEIIPSNWYVVQSLNFPNFIHYYWQSSLSLIFFLLKISIQVIYIPLNPQQLYQYYLSKKKNSFLQLVQNYRVFNAVTVKNKYFLLLISELMSKLQDAKYFTICWGFNIIYIKSRDKYKAVFHKNHFLGLFEYLVMFFGMTNSSVMF